jgi:choline dehydrogenase
VIVGAGSAGAVLAARLSEDPDRRVLLLEAGPDYPTLASMPADLVSSWMSFVDHDWGWTAHVGVGRDGPYPRGKVVGGSSAVNGTIALRGAPADFDEWAAWGLPEWSWEQVLPWFVNLEDDPVGAKLDPTVHGVGGPVPITRPEPDDWQPFFTALHTACLAAGHPDCPDLNAPGASGCGAFPRNRRDRVRMSSTLTHLAPARHRPNLEIRAHVLADRVVVEQGRAVAVEVIADGRRERIAADRIALAAGAVSTPAILLRSGIGPADTLRALGLPVVASLPVGATLLDHPAVGLFAVAAEGVVHDPDVTVEVGLRYTTPDSPDAADMQLYPAAVFDPDMVRAFLPDPVAVVSIGGGCMRARSTGHVTITSIDPTRQPHVDLNYLADPYDLRRFVDMIRFARELFRSPQLRPFVDQILVDDDTIDDDTALGEVIRQQIQTAYHPAGTTPMGLSDDPRAVVDARGRVHGVDRLRVVDASIMPTNVRNNTHLTCVMLGERLAAWMAKEP